MKVNCLALLSIFIFLIACNQPQEENSKTDFSISADDIAIIEDVEEVYEGEDAGYISMIEFFEDQWNIMGGQPYTFQYIREDKNTVDSSFIGLNEAVWAKMTQPFILSDINHPQYKGAYTFEMIEDERQNEILYIYTAQYPHLEVKTTQIRLNKFNHKITSIYIERNFNKETQLIQHKLLYLIGTQLQIHEVVFEDGKEIKNSKDIYKLKF